MCTGLTVGVFRTVRRINGENWNAVECLTDSSGVATRAEDRQDTSSCNTTTVVISRPAGAR